MTKTASSEIIYAAKQGASTRRIEMLDHLIDACDFLAPKGAIQLRAIENYVRRVYGKDAGPRAQTISNERSRHLGMYSYVEARKREATVQSSKMPITNHSLDRAIESLPDIDLRNLMRHTVDRLKIAESTVARAKAAFKQLHPGVNIDDLIAGRTQEVATGYPAAADLSILHRIVSTLTDDVILRSCGLAFDGGVRRRGGTGDELFDAATIARFRQIVDRLS